MTSEGRYEIEAAKQRLAAATEQATSAEKGLQMAEAMLASAKAMLEHAQSQRQSSKKEVDAAKRALKEGEERWQVIDVDASSTADLQANNKKRKVSLSPGTTGAVASCASIARASSVTNSNNVVEYPVPQRTACPNRCASAARASSATTNNNNVGEYPVPQRTARPTPLWAQPRASAAGQSRATAVTPAGRNIILEGSGLDIVDGTYFPSSATSGGAPIYQREGYTPPTEIQYKIYCKRGFWYIGCPTGGAFYRTLEKVKDSDINNNCPPVRDWISTRSGYYEPVPRLRYGNSNGTATAVSAAARKNPPQIQRPGQNANTNHTNTVATAGISQVNETSIIVRGAGVLEANGLYKIDHDRFYHLAPVYHKPDTWKGRPVDFILHLRLDHSGWRISVKEPNSNVTLYEVNCYSYPIEQFPPTFGWFSLNQGVEPAPTLQIQRFPPAAGGATIIQPYIHGVSKSVVSSIVLRGTDIAVNGTYRQYEKRKSYGGAPAFIREDTPGKDTQFSIVRREGKWFIGSGPSDRFPTTMYFRSTKTNSKVPPLDRLLWTSVKQGHNNPPQFLANEAPSDIIVEAFGVPEANGRYRLEAIGADTQGYPEYSREGQMQGVGTSFYINYYNKRLGHNGVIHENCWMITAINKYNHNHPIRYLYHVAGDLKDVDQPPKNGWKLLEDGVAPAPVLKW